jgi:PAS domain S-box-containing protein
MEQVAKSAFSDRKSEIVQAWLQELHAVGDGLISIDIGDHGRWMESFLELCQRRFDVPTDRTIFDFVSSLILKGALSQISLADSVRIFLLMPTAVGRVLAGSESTLEQTKLHLLAEELVVEACRSFQGRLSQAQERFEALFDSADLVILTLDTGGRIGTINRRGAEILGTTTEAVLDQPISRFVASSDLPTLTRSIGHVLAGNPQIFHVRARSGDGKKRYLDVTLTPLVEAGRIVGMRAIARDVTRQIDLQKKLQDSEEKFRNLIEMAGDPIFLISFDDGHLQDANRQARQMCGFTKKEATGRTFMELFHPEDVRRVIAWLQETIAIGSGQAEGLRLVGVGGETTAVEITGAVIEFGGTRVIQGIAKDTGSKHRIEKVLTQQQRKLQAIESQVGRLQKQARKVQWYEVAEEVSVKAMDLLLQDPIDSEETEGKIRRIVELLRPIGPDEEPRLISVQSWLAAFVDLVGFIYAGVVEIQTELTTVPPVRVHPTELRTILLQLILVAVRCSEGRPEPKVLISTHLRGRMVSVEISDAGKTLTGFEVEHLFDERFEYFEREPKVLVKSRSALESWGGGMHVRAHGDDGNLTTLFIPAYSGEPARADRDFPMVPVDKGQS